MTSQTFEDFYSLLEISALATPEEIRKAFRLRIREWHPDLNPSPDATSHTQRLIVAYKILNDLEAKTRYDTEYAKHFPRPNNRDNGKRSEKNAGPSDTSAAQNTTAFSDRILERWIHTARKEAAVEWRQFSSDFKGASKAVFSAAAGAFFVALVLVIIGFVLSKL